MSLAPIILFVHARPEHTKRVITALKENALSKDSNLYIYSDGPRNSSENLTVSSVRKLIKTHSGFKSITIVEREANMGLANNIIDGVTSVINQHGKVIVLEDDIVVSPLFLNFMNAALDRYQHMENVWHISGWNYPIDTNGLDDCFFWRMMNCWGWATWDNRWQHFKKEPQKLLTNWNHDKIRQFNLDSNFDFWDQVKKNANGELNTWAIFWYATIFENHGFCLNISKTLVENIGLDGTGENCDPTDIFTSEAKPRASEVRIWPSNISTNSIALKRIELFYYLNRMKLFKRIELRLKRVFGL